MSIVSIAPEVDRDRYGRPMIVGPQGGKPKPYARCTTFVSAFEDTYNLELWKMRQSAVGLSLRKDLALAVAAHRDDKKRLNAICQEALDAAASSAKATTGTALHALTEQMDRGHEVTNLPDDAMADLAAYAAATREMTPVYIEQLMVLDKLQIAGTPDRVVEYQGQRYIFDLKTGDIEWSAGKIAAQLAVYAHSQVYNLADPQAREVHGASTERGLVVHLPAGSGTCEVKWVDLKAGWNIALTCADVRAKRKLKATDLYSSLTEVTAPTSVPEASRTLQQILANPAPRPLDQQIREASTRRELEVLWEVNQSAWTEDLTALAVARSAELTNLPTAS